MIYYFDIHRTSVFKPMFEKSGVIHRNQFRSPFMLRAMSFPGFYRLPSALFYSTPKFTKGDDKIIIFDTYSKPRMVDWLCKKWPDKRIIFWYWNPVNGSGLREQVPERVEFWSYSKEDCKKFGFRYNTQFFFDCLSAKAELSRTRKARNSVPKALFIGREKGRAGDLNTLAMQLREAGAEPDFRIVRRPEGRYVSIREKLMPYSEVVDMAMGADILVDYSLNPASGLSLRPMEALFFGKKLITNNSEILSADFYSPSNIYVLGHDNRTLREFVECPGTEVLPEVRDGYLLSNWLKRFDESL